MIRFFFFTANGIIFLSALGLALYTVIRSLCMPKASNSVSFDDLLLKLNDHFSPKPSDLEGPFQGKIFLVVICSYSKWSERKTLSDI